MLPRIHLGLHSALMCKHIGITMVVKKIVISQYKGIVDRAATLVAGLKTPPEGWLRTVRKALSMSVVQLAGKLGVTRAQVSKTEKEELSGSVTMKTMKKMAEAMGCHFVYAIVPERQIDDLIIEQAKRKAKHIVAKTNIHMALEDQLLSDEKIKFEIDRLTQEILKEIPSDLWYNEGEKKK